ncbi:MAG: copper chaperone PCu(A)C, partial [Lysobacter sp.]
MTPTRAAAIATLIAIALSAVPACARDCAPRVREGWVRLPPMAMPMMAGFGRIENPCSAPVTITGVSSPAFADTSLHETRVIDGVSRMRALPELRIAPNSV